jgi:transposase-like protein
MSRAHFRTPREGLIVEIRPRCPKCKKEFTINLNNYIPGKYHACYACGTVTQFDSTLAERLQKEIKELEVSIQEVLEGFLPEG